MKTILISGGTGYVGTHLIAGLIKAGYQVHILSRKPQTSDHPQIRYFVWKDFQAPVQAFKGVSTLINLCGTPLAEKRWTDLRKTEILHSRILPLKSLLTPALAAGVKHIISTSAVGYYPEGKHDERSIPGVGFLSNVCVQWENAAKEWRSKGVITDILRFGLVLSPDAPVIQKLLPLARLGINVSVGSGKQKLSWIHVQDLVSIYLFLLEQPLNEVINACSPKSMEMQQFANVLQEGKYTLLPPAPGFVIKGILGQRATLLLDSIEAEPEVLQNLNFPFAYADPHQILHQ
jgi:uncharacterized protein (TIGR01777 family)